MFKVPFEQVLSPVIFEEIEDATGRKSTAEYRLCCLSQEQLLKDGCEVTEDDKTIDESVVKKKRRHTTGPLIKVAKYIGDKWGGKYLRAPDILFVLLEKGQNCVVPLSAVASIDTYLILPKKADQVLVVPSSEIPRRIERFFRPFVRSPKYFDQPWITESPHSILVCKCSDCRTSSRLRDFIKDAADTLARDFNAAPDRDDWFIVTQNPGPVLCQRRFGERHLVLYNPNGYLSYDFYRLFPLSTAKNASLRLAGAMMSTTFWMVKELFGRSNLGDGALKTEGIDYSRMLTYDPDEFSENSVKMIHRLLKRPVAPLEEELCQEDRKLIDECVFDALRFTRGEREAIYDAVLGLVEARLKKAESV